MEYLNKSLLLNVEVQQNNACYLYWTRTTPLEHLVVTGGPNFSYISVFHSSGSLVLILPLFEPAPFSSLMLAQDVHRCFTVS